MPGQPQCVDRGFSFGNIKKRAYNQHTILPKPCHTLPPIHLAPHQNPEQGALWHTRAGPYLLQKYFNVNGTYRKEIIAHTFARGELGYVHVNSGWELQHAKCPTAFSHIWASNERFFEWKRTNPTKADKYWTCHSWTRKCTLVPHRSTSGRVLLWPLPRTSIKSSEVSHEHTRMRIHVSITFRVFSTYPWRPTLFIVAQHAAVKRFKLIISKK